MQKALEIKNLSYRVNKAAILRNISMLVNSGEICAVLGESGSGKSSLLRSIAGFEVPQEGEIILNEKCVSGTGIFIQPEKRNIGLVFQDYALFPHMTVAQNVGFRLKNKSDLDRYLSMLSVAELANRFPFQLSGGQQQRVAIARSLAANPSLLMLDEPFSNLDESLKWSVRHELKKVLAENKITCLLVTHDIEDVLEMAQQVVVLHNGKVEQQGTPVELYHHPVSVYIARLFGAVNIINPQLATLLGKPGVTSSSVIRPEKLCIESGSGNARVIHSHFKGSRFEIHLECNNQFLVAYSSRAIEENSQVRLTCNPSDILHVNE